MEEKSLMCPLCKKFLLKVHDDKVHKVSCKHCRKWIWISANGEFEVKNIPEREASSGKVFW